MNQEEKEKRLKLIERLNIDKSRFGQTIIGADNIKLFINLLYQSLTECVDIVAQNEDDNLLQLSEYELDKMRMFVNRGFNVSVPKAKGLVGIDDNVVNEECIEPLKKLEKHLSEDESNLITVNRLKYIGFTKYVDHYGLKINEHNTYIDVVFKPVLNVQIYLGDHSEYTGNDIHIPLPHIKYMNQLHNLVSILTNKSINEVKGG